MQRHKQNYLIMALYHLIYQSKATLSFSDVELKLLLEKARDFNAQSNITGLLLYGNGYFIQLLEGDDDVVRSLYYQRIAPNASHHDLKVLREGMIEQRLFHRWAMAFRPMDKDNFQAVKDYVNPDGESEYGRNLLAPFPLLVGMEFFTLQMNRKGA
jgi:hypothetical protein